MTFGRASAGSDLQYGDGTLPLSRRTPWATGQKKFAVPSACGRTIDALVVMDRERGAEVELSESAMAPGELGPPGGCALGELPFACLEESGGDSGPPESSRSTGLSDAAGARQFLEMLACCTASYAERCSVGHRVGHGRWASGFCARAAAAVGVEASAELLSIASTEAVDRFDDDADEFVVLRTPELELRARAVDVGVGAAPLLAVVARTELYQLTYDARSASSCLSCPFLSCGLGRLEVRCPAP